MKFSQKYSLLERKVLNNGHTVPVKTAYILFAITAAGVVPFGGLKKYHRTSSIVQVLFLSVL